MIMAKTKTQKTNDQRARKKGYDQNHLDAVWKPFL